MSEVVKKLEEVMQGFPKGDYLKTWDYPNGKTVGISSCKGIKKLYIGIGEKDSNTINRIGMIDRDKAQEFVDLFNNPLL